MYFYNKQAFGRLLPKKLPLLLFHSWWIYLLAALPSSAAVNDTTSSTFTHQIGIELSPSKVLRSDPFYKGYNGIKIPSGHSLSGHLKYAFTLPKGTLGGQAFPNTSQGLGISYYNLSSSKELGNPIVAYLFQRSEIAKLGNHLSLDYEWNLGLSTGWKPYHPENNPNNLIIGSKTNAYINLGIYLGWQVRKGISMTGGIDFSHFSNGNTEYPNAGLNSTGLRLGVMYDLNKSRSEEQVRNDFRIPAFTRHISYDMVVFGSWRRKGVEFFGRQIPSPEQYAVVGGYFAPMYNWGYRFRTGFSLDALYDGSANVYTEDFIVGTQQDFFKPDWDRQVALGLSARADYTMPIFTIGIGIGTNVLHKGGDFRGLYQTLALKVKATKNSFVHIGYNLKDFHDPNYLMLGIGYRFNNRIPSLLSR